MYRTDFDTHHRIASAKPCSSELHTSIVDLVHLPPTCLYTPTRIIAARSFRLKSPLLCSFRRSAHRGPIYLLRPSCPDLPGRPFAASYLKTGADAKHCLVGSLTELIIFDCTANRAYLLLLMLLLLLLLLATRAAATTATATATAT